MSVPYLLQSESFPRTLSFIRKALEDRITNATNRLSITPSYHRGSPDPNNLPDEILGVWLDWEQTGRDEDEPYEATMLQTTWRISIVAKDEDNDTFGSDAPLAERVWGDILKTLTETNVDIGLDGSCDFVPTPETSHMRGTLGDRRVEVVELTLLVHWCMQQIRVP